MTASRLALVMAGALLLPGSLPAQARLAPLPPLVADTGAIWDDPYANPCVPDVGRAIRALARRGRPVAFRLAGAEGVGGWRRHWQGVQRLSVQGGSYLVVSRSGGRSGVVVARFGSADASGGPLGLNIPASRAEEVEPAPGDSVIAELPMEPGLRHAGGIQAIGPLLLVPYDGGGGSRVVIYDMADPAHPERVTHLDHGDVGPPSDPDQAASVGVVRLADGRYLLVVGVHSSKWLDVYVTRQPSLRAPGGFERVAAAKGPAVGGFQNLNLVAQCDGTIYLVGAHNTAFPPPSLGHDHLHWYRLTADGRGLLLEEEGEVRMKCERCNYGAGGGVYVDPARRLVVYGVEFWSSGGRPRVSVEEFSPVGAPLTPGPAGAPPPP